MIQTLQVQVENKNIYFFKSQEWKKVFGYPWIFAIVFFCVRLKRLGSIKGTQTNWGLWFLQFICNNIKKENSIVLILVLWKGCVVLLKHFQLRWTKHCSCILRVKVGYEILQIRDLTPILDAKQRITKAWGVQKRISATTGTWSYLARHVGDVREWRLQVRQRLKAEQRGWRCRSEQVTTQRMVDFAGASLTMMRWVSYLKDADERLSGQLVLDDREELAEGLQEGWGTHTLTQQVLDCGQDVQFCLLRRRKQKPGENNSNRKSDINLIHFKGIY